MQVHHSESLEASIPKSIPNAWYYLQSEYPKTCEIRLYTIYMHVCILSLKATIFIFMTGVCYDTKGTLRAGHFKKVQYLLKYKSRLLFPYCASPKMGVSRYTII